MTREHDAAEASGVLVHVMISAMSANPTFSFQPGRRLYSICLDWRHGIPEVMRKYVRISVDEQASLGDLCERNLADALIASLQPLRDRQALP